MAEAQEQTCNPLRQLVDVSELDHLREIKAAAHGVIGVLRDIHHVGGVPDARDVLPELRAQFRITLSGLTAAVLKDGGRDDG